MGKTGVSLRDGEISYVLSFSRTVPTDKEIFLCGLCLCGEIKPWQGLLKSKKKIGGNHVFYSNNYSKKKNSKINSNVWCFFPNRSFLNSEKCMVTPNFLFGYQGIGIVLKPTKISLY